MLLVIGNNITNSYTGNRLIISGESFPGVIMGESNDDRGFISWNTTDNFMYAGTVEGGTTYNNTLILKGGNVGIGAESPARNIDIHGGTSASFIGFHNDYTSNSATDGLLVGISPAQTGYLWNYENTPIWFGTNDLTRISITGAGNVGIGTTTPDAKLDIRGAIKIVDGTEGNDKVLTSDANGLASWQTPASGSLWTQNGDEIYFNNNVGIGTNNPAFELDIIDDAAAAYARIQSTANNAALLIERTSTSDMTATIYKTGGANNFYTGLLGSSSYKISTQNPTLNGLEVEIDGDVNLSDELHAANTGTANMMPFAYGHISEAAAKNGCTSNVGTVSKYNIGQYTVNIAGLGTDYTVVVTTNQGTAYLTCVVTARSSTYFNVSVWDTKNDGYKDGGFSFVVYKP